MNVSALEQLKFEKFYSIRHEINDTLMHMCQLVSRSIQTCTIRVNFCVYYFVKRSIN